MVKQERLAFMGTRATFALSSAVAALLVATACSSDPAADDEIRGGSVDKPESNRADTVDPVDGTGNPGQRMGPGADVPDADAGSPDSANPGTGDASKPCAPGLRTVNGYCLGPPGVSQMAPVPVPIFGHVCVTGADGRIFVFGPSSGAAFAAFAYDPVGNAWSTLAPIPHPAAYWPSIALAPDGRIWVFGTISSNAPVDVYDPKTNSWTPGPIRFPYAQAVGLFVGTQFHAVSGNGGTFAFATDTVTGTSMPRTDPAPERFLRTVASVANDKIYAIGGSRFVQRNSGVSSVDVPWVARYDAVSRTWSALADLPYAAVGIASSPGPDGEIYAFGGGGVMTGVARAQVHSYRVATNDWMARSPLPAATMFSCASLAKDGRIFVIGGRNAGQTSNSVFAYTP